MADHRKAFEAFHVAHPDVLDHLVRIATEAHDKGLHLGIGTFWEVMRWRIAESGGAVQLNNTYRAYYARKIAFERPHLAHLFKSRRSPRDES